MLKTYLFGAVAAAALFVAPPASALVCNNWEDAGESFQPTNKVQASQMSGECWSSLDSDGDGSISQDEWNAGHDAWFTHVDKDGDGVISRVEAHKASDPD